MNEETKNRLKNLLSSYADMEADESFIRSAISIVLIGLGLEEYVKKIVYIPTYGHLDPQYEDYTKGIAGFFGQAAYAPLKTPLLGVIFVFMPINKGIARADKMSKIALGTN